MCDGGDGGDIICADDGDGIDGLGGCSLKGCLANVFIFLPLTVILFYLMPQICMAFLERMQNISGNAFDYGFWLLAALTGIIVTALYFLPRFFKWLYRALDKLLHIRF